jgi:hypothetical protein
MSITLKYHRQDNYFDNMTLPEQTITMEVPSEELLPYQMIRLFASFMRSMGFSDYEIMDAGMHIALFEDNDDCLVQKVLTEYELCKNEDYVDLKYENADLKAKLSRVLNPDAPNYTDDEISAMTLENSYEFGLDA